MKREIFFLRMIFASLLLIVTAVTPAAGRTPAGKGAWIRLFDGKTFDGWRGYNRADMPGVWVVEDGAMKIRSKKIAGSTDRGDIVFDRKFRNFDLEFEFKVSKGANCGVFYLVTEKAGQRIFQSAPEYQVLDNENHPDARKGTAGNRRSASLYDMIPARPQNARPYGQWNRGRIVVRDGRVAHYQNGKKVVEYRLGTPEWKTMVEHSKFAQWPGFLTPGGPEREGFIGLQDHGDDVWFRNLRVRELK